MQQYRNGNFDVSRIITQHYSTSFSLGIRLLPKEVREAIHAIYAFVRYGDEIVDTFHSKNQQQLLQRYKEDFYYAYHNGISTNPILDAFQEVVRKYQIPVEYVDAFLYSMEMDLTCKYFSKKELDLYIYGSAEVVGLMCLKVFVRNETEFERLIPYAKALGAAFQKINFLRDVKSDYEERGRIYFPKEYYCGDPFGEECKKRFEAEIREDFRLALIGIRMLPASVRLGVYLAYQYFLSLFHKIEKTPAATLKNRRIRINNFHKTIILSRCLVFDRLQLSS
ncbi:MAG: phytoene/squalene synthase family protein [Bacteroidia bacterium]|nr:phytoene/squalene synthase family protein [Bacteroidia bacterium]